MQPNHNLKLVKPATHSSSPPLRYQPSIEVGDVGTLYQEKDGHTTYRRATVVAWSTNDLIVRVHETGREHVVPRESSRMFVSWFRFIKDADDREAS